MERFRKFAPCTIYTMYHLHHVPFVPFEPAKTNQKILILFFKSSSEKTSVINSMDESYKHKIKRSQTYTCPPPPPEKNVIYFPIYSKLKRRQNKSMVEEIRMAVIPGWGRSQKGKATQYSCLGNPMDRGAWQATVRSVAKELNTI